MTKDEALKQALEALEPLVRRAAPWGEMDWLNGCKAITAIKEALAQPEKLREENERLHVENRRLIDRIETIGVPIGVGGFATTTSTQPEQQDTVQRLSALVRAQQITIDKLEAQPEPMAVYGYCPQCGAKGVMRERRPNGNDKCANGHTYPSSTSTPPQRKPLTDEEIDELSRSMVKGDKSVNWLCRAIEAAHGIKENT